jgi:hypothetical protein
MLATVDQLEARLGVPAGSLAGEDLARAQAVLDDASTIVLMIGDPGWTDADGAKPAPGVVQVVVLRLARRFWDNPEGLAYEALGDHTVSHTALGGFLTDAERALVMGAAGYPQLSFSVETRGIWS